MRTAVAAAKRSRGCREKRCRNKDGGSGIQNDLNHGSIPCLNGNRCRVRKDYAPHPYGGVDLNFATDRQHGVDDTQQKTGAERPFAFI
ncbi:hypothetical protein [Rhizobium yanglingense]